MQTKVGPNDDQPCVVHADLYVPAGVARRPAGGMIGGSYGGQIQYAMAEHDKRVDALIAIITWNG